MLKVLKYFFYIIFFSGPTTPPRSLTAQAPVGEDTQTATVEGLVTSIIIIFFIIIIIINIILLYTIIIIIIIIIPGQSELQPALDGRRSGINSDHKNSKAAHHSECEKQWQSNYIRYKHSQCEQPECENCETGCE